MDATGGSNLVGQFGWFVFGWVNKLTNNLNGSVLSGAGHHTWGGHNVRTLLLSQSTHDHLNLTTVKQSSHREDTWSDTSRLGSPLWVIQNSVDAVTINRSVSTTETSGCDSSHFLVLLGRNSRDAYSGNRADEVSIGPGSATPDGASTEEIIASHSKWSRKPVKTEFVGVLLRDFHKFGENADLARSLFAGGLNNGVDQFKLGRSIPNHESSGSSQQAG